VGDRPGVARALIKQAMTIGYAGQPERAIELDRRALAMIDEASQPRLAMSATTNLVQDLQAAGRLDEALALVPEARRLELAHGSGTDLRRLRWTEGVLARDTGDLETAERLLLEVREELVEDGNAYDAALVSLELAVLYAEEGRAADTRRLAEEMLPIFQSHDIGREAMASLMLFQQAALAERLTAGLAREVAQAMRHGRSARSATPPPAPS
jgi:tetratricopeptide (TPR) repeat protein